MRISNFNAAGGQTMKYDFDTVINRRNTNSLMWDIAEGELPMWVADMDFKTAPEIQKAILDRAGHGIFGYNIIPEKWYDAYIEWWEERHKFSIKKDWLIFCTGVVPAISSVVRKLTTAAENVLIQTPVYNIFFNSIVNNGRNVLQSPLKYDGSEYTIDFDDLESKLALPQTTMMILCNPHNPVGKIWDKETLARIGALCRKHNVVVVSDEIHCDITNPDREYVPFASVSDECRDNSITCIAPTKTFNIAGLQTAAVAVPNEALRNRVNRALNTDEIAEPNSFAVDVAVAAFKYGGEWLDELREYIFANKNLVTEFLADKLPKVKAVPSDATYLMWIDCQQVTDDTDKLTKQIRQSTGLYLSAGAQFGGNGKGFVRLNTACSRKTLNEGLERFAKGIEVAR